jgi:hypothetical protein
MQGVEMNDVFYRYYKEKLVQNKDRAMLNRLVRAKHIRYIFRDGVAFAEATEIGRNLHPCPPPTVITIEQG